MGPCCLADEDTCVDCYLWPNDEGREKEHNDEILRICLVEDDFWQDQQNYDSGCVKSQNKFVFDKEEWDTMACGYRCHHNMHVYPCQDNKVLNPRPAPFSRAGEGDLLQTCRNHNVVPWRAPFGRAGESDILHMSHKHIVVPWPAPFRRAGEVKEKLDHMFDTLECFSSCFIHDDNLMFIQT